MARCALSENTAVFNTGPRPNGIGSCRTCASRWLPASKIIPRPRASGSGPRRTPAMVARAPRSATMLRYGCRRTRCSSRSRALDGSGCSAPQLDQVQHWALPSTARTASTSITKRASSVACDDGALVQLIPWPGDTPRVAASRRTRRNLLRSDEWPRARRNRRPGLVRSIDPRTGNSTQFTAALGAQTTAWSRRTSFLCAHLCTRSSLRGGSPAGCGHRGRLKTRSASECGAKSHRKFNDTCVDPFSILDTDCSA